MLEKKKKRKKKKQKTQNANVGIIPIQTLTKEPYKRVPSAHRDNRAQ